jgi:hypothetical protein
MPHRGLRTTVLYACGYIEGTPNMLGPIFQRAEIGDMT